MADCAADVSILPTGQDVTIGDGMALSISYTFAEADETPWPVDADTVTATIGDEALTVAQVDASTFTISADAEVLAELRSVLPWRVDVPGVARFAGTFRRTSRAGCSSADPQTVTVTTGDTVVAVTVNADAALAAQVVALTARVADLEVHALLDTLT